MGKKKPNVILNFFYNSIYQILLIILPLITTPYISRVLKAEGIGLYSYSYSIAAVFALFGMLGVNNYGSRIIAIYQDDRKKRSEAFWNVFAVQLYMSLLVLLAYAGYIIFICEDDYKIIFVVQTLTIISSLFDINWFFFGIEKFKLTVTRNVIVKIAAAVCILLFVNDESDVLIYTGLNIGSLVISNLILWTFLKKEVDFCRPRWRNMKKHIPQLIILFIPVIAISVYNKMDKIMLGYMSTLTQNGLYENAEKTLNLPMGFITALGTVMLPRMSNLSAKGEVAESKRYIKISMEFVCFLGMALSFGTAAIAKEFSPIFFGNGFEGVATLIILLSPTLMIKAWANVIRTQYLIPLQHDRVYVVSVCLGAIVNLLFNLILIPRYAAIGAVIGTIIAEVVVMLYQTFFVRYRLPIFQYVKQGIYYLFAGAVMFLVVRLFGNCMKINIINLLLEIALGVTVYLILCFPYIFFRYKTFFHTLRK